MSLLTLIVVLIVVGLVIWLIQSYLPIAQPIKTIIIVLIVLVLIVWLLGQIGLLPGLHL
jgi:cytochrome b subunit of formate dehydrogenase